MLNEEIDARIESLSVRMRDLEGFLWSFFKEKAGKGFRRTNLSRWILGTSTKWAHSFAEKHFASK